MPFEGCRITLEQFVACPALSQDATICTPSEVARQREVWRESVSTKKRPPWRIAGILKLTTEKLQSRRLAARSYLVRNSSGLLSASVPVPFPCPVLTL